MSLKNLNVKIKIPKLLKNKLKNKRINQIYRNFEEILKIDKNFVVAVSGGPDSLALAFLAKIYSIKKNLNAKFLIVDHKLRSNSSKEANIVKKILKKNYIDSEILRWNGKKPTKNIQAKARKKRYELLLSKSKALKINNILLGHHQDDLFENFFIRFLRGSGLKGLISMDFKTKLSNINLLRPLLNQKKQDLEFISNYIFQFYISDPSNKDEKYQRIRVRKLIEDLQKNGLSKDKFNMTIKNLKHSDVVINYYVNQNLKKNSFFSVKKNSLILNQIFFQQPHEVVFRAFSDSLKRISKRYYPVRGKKLDKIILDISNNSTFNGTLGGCIIKKVNQSVIISKEN